MKFPLTIWVLGVAFLFVTGENIYLARVNNQQAHTIRQYMGLENGPDATPRPKDESPLSSAPNPPVRNI